MKQTSVIGQPPEVKFIDPAAIISRLNFREGMKVADFGCATGYFAFPLARRVGRNGEVYALDILAEKLETVESQARLSGLTNIITKRANLEKMGGSKLPDGSMDWVFLVNMLFQNKDKDTVIQEAKRVLREDGLILAIEWNDSATLFGPPRDTRIAKDKLLKLMDKNGLKLEREVPVSDLHYGLLLKK